MAGDASSYIAGTDDDANSAGANVAERTFIKQQVRNQILDIGDDYRDEIKDKANFQIASLNEHKLSQTGIIINAIEKLRSKIILSLSNI